MATKKPKKSSKKTRKLSDLAPRASRIQDVKGGALSGFIKFGDIKGESTDKDHKDWVM